jgi:hypothetical protein
MSNNAIIPAAAAAAAPVAADVSVRQATDDDIPFIDALQKRHRKQVGFMSRGQLEGKIAAREVLVAEGPLPEGPLPDPLPGGEGGRRVGYVIGTDRYFKHDDVGIVYHLNVAPGAQRGFVGATLLKAMFDRAAYGCKLFCCWCAQDIEANRFWEAMGFVPLAYRAGSEKKSRVHIFWQKRIRAGDTTTPWWFPSQTTGGAIREDRLVLPIPPGTHWSDAKPVVLPGERTPTKQLDAPRAKPIRDSRSGIRNATHHGILTTAAIGLRFVPVAPVAPPKPEKKDRRKKAKRKNDARLVAAARELKDRWLEYVNTGGDALVPRGKYDLNRALPQAAHAAGTMAMAAAAAAAAGAMPRLPPPLPLAA